MDKIHRVGAIAEDNRRPPGGDGLHPSNEHFRVRAEDIHPRPVHVEIPQRDVLEPVHLVEAAKQAFIEELRGAVERPVRVGMMRLEDRKCCGQAVHRRRRSGNDLPYSGAGGRFEHVEGAVDENVFCKARLFGALRDADGGLVEDEAHASHRTGHIPAIAHVALDNP